MQIRSPLNKEGLLYIDEAAVTFVLLSFDCTTTAGCGKVGPSNLRLTTPVG